MVQVPLPLPSPDAGRGRCHVVISLETGAVWQQRRRAGFSTGSGVTMRPRQAEGSIKIVVASRAWRNRFSSWPGASAPGSSNDRIPRNAGPCRSGEIGRRAALRTL